MRDILASLFPSQIMCVPRAVWISAYQSSVIHITECEGARRHLDEFLDVVEKKEATVGFILLLRYLKSNIKTIVITHVSYSFKVHHPKPASVPIRDMHIVRGRSDGEQDYRNLLDNKIFRPDFLNGNLKPLIVNCLVPPFGNQVPAEPKKGNMSQLTVCLLQRPFLLSWLQSDFKLSVLNTEHTQHVKSFHQCGDYWWRFLVISGKYSLSQQIVPMSPKFLDPKHRSHCTQFSCPKILYWNFILKMIRFNGDMKIMEYLHWSWLKKCSF